MPTNCCVPLCTRKDKRDEDTGEIIHFFRFPDDENTRKLWLHAIRRDVGPYFSITHGTRVCSRHFKSEDLRKTPNKTFLRPGAVPSIFAWKRSSPRKRPPPTYRSEPHLFPKKSKKDKDNVPKTDNTDLQRKKIETAPSTSTSHDPKTEKLSVESQETTEVAAPTESESGSEMSEIVNKDSFIRELQDRLDEALSDKEKLEEKVSQLMEKSTKLEGRLFCFENISNNDSLITFYTGFPNLKTLMALYEFLRPGANGENIRYSSSARDDIQEGHGEHSAKQGRPRSLKTIDEFFLTLCRLRQGFAEIHLAQLFNVSQSTVGRILISWINFMYLKLGQINIWPSRELVDESMPQDFKDKYPSTRVIIDCTEVRCEMPSSLLLNTELFSSYKNHATLKALVGISPKGFFTFIGQLYFGSISDREMVERSGFLNLPFLEGDSVMADKGFTIEDILPLGVSLNIPPFLGMSDQMAPEDVISTQEIASLRIHVERAINKVKNFKIFDGLVPLNQFGLVNQMWCVCAMLCNMQDPIIST
ncbi:uncharacterized protein LOC122953764 [Acropora millepora]|uniref:uncharacterized protein LOC122953764 n=1 Tax=Acropora millepora TaxID=45264 RepID=UPI001CF1A73D|nr:uncharacterized protein LOC122953764 [Acropora millepora]